MLVQAQQLLQKYFGYTSFKEGQAEIIGSLLEGGDTLAIMPTGAGKSLCYQLPSLILGG
ncbi:MAG: DEAD/DEAH box helicase, partial [Firmicutes bacterium]|nr:DEAD/DEAH box helicase [Bacillota bacterium]